MASPIQAAELGFGVGYAGEHTDNIRLAPTSIESEWINKAILGVAYKEIGPTLYANVSAEAQYLNYKNQTYEDGMQYYADAAMLWAISPQRFHWVLIDRAERTTIDNTKASTPDNQANVNVVYTGPDAFIRLGPVNKLVFDGRVGRATYSVGNYGNSRYSTSARWLYASTPSLTYSLNYQFSKINYDDDIANDNFHRHDAFGRIAYREQNTVFQIDAGNTSISQERGGDTSDPTFRLTTTHRLTQQSTFSVLLASEFLDFALDLLTTATDPTETLTSPSSRAALDVTEDIYHTKRADVNYLYKAADIGFGTSAFYRNIDYKTAPQDNKNYGAQLDIWKSLSPTLTIGLNGRYSKVEYINVEREDQNTLFGARIVYYMTRNLSSSLQAVRTRQESTDLGQEFTENRILVGLVFNTNPSLAPIRH
jgi:hypothetical protein